MKSLCAGVSALLCVCALAGEVRADEIKPARPNAVEADSLRRLSLMVGPLSLLNGTLRLYGDVRLLPRFSLEADVGGGTSLINQLLKQDIYTARAGAYAKLYVLGHFERGLFVSAGPRVIYRDGYSKSGWEALQDTDLPYGPSTEVAGLLNVGGKFVTPDGLTMQGLLGMGGGVAFLENLNNSGKQEVTPGLRFNAALQLGYSF